MASHLSKLVCSHALSFWSKISVSFLWGQTHSNTCWVLSASCITRQSCVSPLSVLHPQESLLHSPRRQCLVCDEFLNSILLGRLRMVPLQGLPFLSSVQMMDPSFICCNILRYEGLSLSFKTYQQLKRNGFSLSFVFDCEPPTNLLLHTFKSSNLEWCY
jgi:hypothetical protein